MAPFKQNVNLELKWLNKHPFKGIVFNNLTNYIIKVQKDINRRWYEIHQKHITILGYETIYFKHLHGNTHDLLLGMVLKHSFVCFLVEDNY